ncbi:tre-2, partial [Pristionchus pacificus]
FRLDRCGANRMRIGRWAGFRFFPSPLHSQKSLAHSRPVALLREHMDRDSIDPTLSVFCHGSLLHSVQTARLFPDSKHFVDMPLTADPDVILDRWARLNEKGDVDEETLVHFVSQYFDEPGSELECIYPTDFKDKIDSFLSLRTPFKEWAEQIHGKWPVLTRRVKEEILERSNRCTLIPLPYPFVVPGGRFRELYYWDSFFTIKGLLVSKMYETARGMILNMKSLIDRFGFVPNGNRLYYLNRSQPPLLTWCLNAYFESTGDTDFLREILPTLIKELHFFDLHRSIIVDGSTVPLYHHKVIARGPRPESYREDMHTAANVPEEDRNRLYGDIAAAAESGRDFSSRWASHANTFHLHNTRTQDFLPVDLNSIICMNLRLISNMFITLEEHENAAEYDRRSKEMKEEIRRLFWSESQGMWFDFDLRSNKRSHRFYDSHLLPLYADIVHEDFDLTRVIDYLNRNGLISEPGGIPSSTVATGEQWDYPNAWAPIMWIIIQGLRKNGAMELSRNLTAKWLTRILNEWRRSGGKMFEKYDVTSFCGREKARGGEYEVQEGFGWTNGVVLDLLMTYPDIEPTNQECPCCQAN